MTEKPTRDKVPLFLPVVQKSGLRGVRIALLSIASAVVLLMVFEDKFVYFPAVYPDGFWSVRELKAREGELFPAIEDCWFVAEDGVKLHGWLCNPFIKRDEIAEPVESTGVLLWFHGNAGNISHRYEMIRALMSIPVTVFIIDYRGYGRSEGKPSEEGLYKDALAAWNYLVFERGLDSGKIVIFGKSLGGVPAADLATRVNPAGLIVQSSFTSASDMAARVLPLYPRFLVRARMNSIEKIRNVTCPKLFIHSPADEIVPYELGRKLFDAAPQPKQFFDVPGARHNETYMAGGPPYLEAIRQFVQSSTTD